MLFGNPFYANDADGYCYATPSNHHRYYNRARVMEEARRRAQLEKYYREKAAEEEEARRREYFGRLREREREEEVHRRSYAEAIHRRMMEDKERRNRRSRTAFYVGDGSDHDTDSVVVDRPACKIVQGPDGRHYRIKTNTKSEPTHPKKKQSVKIHSKRDAGETAEQPTKPQTLASSTIPTVLSTTIESNAGLRRESGKEKGLKKPRRKATVIVEDASDGEDENELDSVWRNRRPSPGQWLEPVDDFEGLTIN